MADGKKLNQEAGPVELSEESLQQAQGGGSFAAGPGDEASKLKVNHTLFKEDGTPLRAKLDSKLEGQ